MDGVCVCVYCWCAFLFLLAFHYFTCFFFANIHELLDFVVVADFHLLLPISDVTASRDLNDYVITEKWRDVEQALPGDTKILPIWLAWGSAQNEVYA